jgi:hypothetical protein
MEGRGGLAHRIPARLTAAEGRKFAFPVGGAFLVLSGITAWRDHAVISIIFAVVAGLLVVAGAVAPARLGPVYHAWMRLAELISRVTTPVFMGVLYFLVIMPVGVVRRRFGKNPLVHAPTSDSYWISRTHQQSDLKRQF